MLKKVIKELDLERLSEFFKDIRFYMGHCALEGVMGEAYVDNIDNPKIAILLVRQYCFMSGEIEKNDLRKLIEDDLRKYKIIPSDNLKVLIEEIYKDNIIKNERYSIKKNPIFNCKELQSNITDLSSEYKIKAIDEVLASRIKNEQFINITDNYEKYGIGYCCLYNDEIIGVASSNIFYKNGIEVNIRVKEEHRRKGIATAIASKLILKCLEINKKVSWDAANLSSVGLAEKLGFQYDSTYNIYHF